jgi:hypothetical protein
MGESALTQPLPPHERPTAAQLAGGSSEPMQIAGQPADVCPNCGAGMFAYRTETLTTRIDRYVRCRNKNCGKRFISRQPQPQPPVLVREVGGDDFSSGGTEQLTVYHRTA